MNKFFRFLFAALAVISLASCRGNVDNGTDVEEGVLRISADKTTIMADGNETVSFKIMFGSKDVSNEKTLQLVRTLNGGDEKVMAYGANQFSTVTAGTYKFKAKYYYGGNHVSENEVEVVAEQYFTGEEKSYKQRIFGTMFTSVGCTSCPVAAKSLKELREKNPGLISAAAFHQDFTITDPMTIAETESMKSALGGFQGLPAFFWNMREGSNTGKVDTDGLNAEMASYSAYSGVAINTKFDKSTSKLEVEVGVTSNLPSSFRYLIILVEDEIDSASHGAEYKQNGEEYVHQNVVRAVLTNVIGDKLNGGDPLTVGVEAKASKSITLDSGWNPNNMRVIAVAVTSEDNWKSFAANNVNECKVGESVSYIYE